MRTTSPLFVLATISFAALAAPGCLIVDESGESTHSSTTVDTDGCCREVRTCETVCDDYGCYDECVTERRCPDTCRARTCAGDLDCPEGRVCIDGTCTERNFDQTSTGGLCQSCTNAYDCAEPDSRCVRLYFERTPKGGPKVCATDCESETDCPLGFECVDEPGSPRVCVPDEELGGTDRVCPDDHPDGIECFSSDNCDTGESCIDNQCVAPDGECSEDADCGRGATCRNFQCVDSSTPECIDRTDCHSGEICVDGRCTARDSGEACVRNDECQGDAVCVDGSCLARCSDRSDCNTSSEICREGLCQPIECRFNSDCDAGEVCVDAVCKPNCETDSDCDAGYRCSDAGYCERDPAVECRSEAECLSGETCFEGTCTTICNCNQHCADGEVCDSTLTDDANTGLCREPESTTDSPQCSNDCQCPSGESCVDGTCTAETSG